MKIQYKAMLELLVYLYGIAFTNVSKAGAGVAVWFLLGLGLSCWVLPDTVSAFVYGTPTGTLKDNYVMWNNGTFYLLSMYQEEDSVFNDMWLATSTDGVHWEDVGAVINDAPFSIWAMRAWKVGDRFILDHGSHTDSGSPLLRFWESTDLIHWSYLGEEYDVYRPDGGRLDHMDVVAVEENGQTQWYGYAAGGLLRSEDGVKWTWKEDFQLTSDNWDVGETGGCEKIGDKYYLFGGNWQDPRLSGNADGLPGDANYSVLTFVGDDPEGPFAPDYEALRLNGYSGSKPVALWAGYCRTPDQLLLTNYIVDPSSSSASPVFWHSLLKKAVVDEDGHLRTGYWEGNEAIKGNSISLQPGKCTQLFPSSAGALSVEGDVVQLTRSAAGEIGMFEYSDPQTAVALLSEQFDTQKGFVFEGRMKVDPLGFGRPSVGLYLEEGTQQGTAVLFRTYGLTEIGTLDLADNANFESKDRTGYGCATVAGIELSEFSSFRLLYRMDMFELYLDDLLVQTYYTSGATGRVGFVVQDGQATFDNLKAWEMNLDDSDAQQKIVLKNAASDKEQAGGSLTVSETIDGVFAGVNGWGCEDATGVTSARTAVWETLADASFSSWTFKLHQLLAFDSNTDYYAFKKIRISYTTDDRDTFADGIGVDGDIDANWIELTPSLAYADYSTATINADNTISWTNPNDPDTYTIVVDAKLSGVTGFRLEILEEDGAVGWWWIDGNAVLTEFEVFGSNLILGDANRDGKVDESDASILADNWLKNSDATWNDGDFNGDGKVDDVDAAILAANWNYGVEGGSGSIPEPSVWILLICGATVALIGKHLGR